MSPQKTNKGKKIGLLGGSFNPAHEGHLTMSLFALERLNLDEVWWLVSPQNPLKSQENMALLKTRVQQAQHLTKAHRKIKVSILETRLKTTYTIDTLRALKEKFPAHFFVWLMGEDNLKSFHLWKSWEEIFASLPIAVFRRSGYSRGHRRSEAEVKFKSALCPLVSVDKLAVSPPPVWVVLDNELNPISATQIRDESISPTERRSSIMVVKKPAAKKTASKATAKKTTAKRKPAAKKTVVKKATTAKKTVAKKATVKKTVAKKATTAKKATVKKTAVKKPAAKKTAAKKMAACKTTATKAVTKRTPAAKKTTARKTVKKVATKK
ncbi:MAG: nicotinate (nicotinamide) nucleotide adenylyltransferase [Bdellovibrionales bacterium]